MKILVRALDGARPSEGPTYVSIEPIVQTAKLRIENFGEALDGTVTVSLNGLQVSELIKALSYARAEMEG